MNKIHQIIEWNRYLFISLTEIMVYTVLLSLILYHLVIYFGRRDYIEGKFYLHFIIYVVGLLLYLFIDTNSYIILFQDKININNWSTFFKAVSFLIIYKAIILILNPSVGLSKESQKSISNLYKYYSIFNLIWLSPLFLNIGNLTSEFWMVNFLFVTIISFIYLRKLIVNEPQIEKSIRIIGILTITYIFYIVIYRLAVGTIRFIPREYFWIVNNFMKITVAFLFVYALAWKSNKDFYDLQELKKGLEKKVDEKTKDLQIAKEKIEKASEQRRNYFINLAHETKTPLTLISNYLDRYIRSAEHSQELTIIKENIEKLKSDMLGFLDVEKFEQGSITFNHNETTCFSELIKNKVSIYEVNASNKGLKISFDIKDNIFIKADPYAIDSIINNLFDNAIKYSTSGDEVNVELIAHDSYSLLTVNDTGIGIEKEKVEHIFEPYYQISHQKTNIQGLGMGLFIVKNIVDSLNGTLDIESELNQGTIFTIKIPLCKVPDAIEPVDIHAEKSISERKQNKRIPEFISGMSNIFIVEDNKDMSDYLCQELEECYNVFCSSNGKEALEQLKSLPQIDVIISDVMMDEMDGYEFYDKVSKNESYSGIPFIFLTARSDETEKIKYLTVGVTDYIYKPFSIDEIKAKIQSILINTSEQRKIGLKSAVLTIQNQINGNTRIDADTKDKWGIFETKIREYELSKRQVEIIKFVEQGLEYKEIADELNISVKTVHRHIQNLFEKVTVHSKIELLKALFE